jgi:hypothetical protein
VRVEEREKERGGERNRERGRTRDGFELKHKLEKKRV